MTRKAAAQWCSQWFADLTFVMLVHFLDLFLVFWTMSARRDSLSRAPRMLVAQRAGCETFILLRFSRRWLWSPITFFGIWRMVGVLGFGDGGEGVLGGGEASVEEC